jgi:heptosyltransferase-2
LAFLTSAGQRYGYDNKKFAFLLNHRIKDELPAMDPVSHQFRLLGQLGIALEDPTLELWPSESDQAYVIELLSTQWLSANQRLVGINISASPRWLTKCWPKPHIAKLCEELGLRDIRVVITGTEYDLADANTLANLAKNTKIINTCGKTSINQLACLIKRCSVYISADSSPLHVAASQGIPFVALFGPTDPQRHLPPANNYLVLKKDLDCSPCYRAKCKTNKCMKLITPQEVLEAIEKLL